MQFTAMPSIFPLFKISSPCLYLEILFIILLGSDIGSPAMNPFMVGGAEFFHDQSLSKIGFFFFLIWRVFWPPFLVPGSYLEENMRQKL